MIRRPRAIAPEVTMTTSSPLAVQLADLRADAVQHVRAERAVLAGDDRGAEFRDDGHRG